MPDSDVGGTLIRRALARGEPCRACAAERGPSIQRSIQGCARQRLATIAPPAVQGVLSGSVRRPVRSSSSRRSYRHISHDVCLWNVKLSQELVSDWSFAAREFISRKDAVPLPTEILALDQDAIGRAAAIVSSCTTYRRRRGSCSKASPIAEPPPLRQTRRREPTAGKSPPDNGSTWSTPGSRSVPRRECWSCAAPAMKSATYDSAGRSTTKTTSRLTTRSRSSARGFSCRVVSFRLRLHIATDALP